MNCGNASFSEKIEPLQQYRRQHVSETLPCCDEALGKGFALEIPNTQRESSFVTGAHRVLHRCPGPEGPHSPSRCREAPVGVAHPSKSPGGAIQQAPWQIRAQNNNVENVNIIRASRRITV